MRSNRNLLEQWSKHDVVQKDVIVLDTSSRDRASAMVTMYSEGPTKARQRLSLLTVRASGARSVPRATTLPRQSDEV